jgi:hypothetical protein
MKTLVAAFITALLVFTLATVWIDVVQPRLDVMAAAQSAADGDRVGIARRGQRRSTREQQDHDETTASESRGNRSSRESSNASAESKARLLSQLEQMKAEEAKLLERQQTMEMLYRDIFRELAEVESIRRKSASELALAERQTPEGLGTKSRVATAATNRDAAPAQTVASKDAAESRMAGVIEELVKRDRVPAAATLLSGLRDREVAKILSLLNARDPKLASRLTDQVQSARQATIRR